LKFEKFDEASGAFTFRFQGREYSFFKDLLSDYPLQKGARQPIGGAENAEEMAEEQALLEESLDEHRANSRKQLQDFLAKDERLARDKCGWKLVLDAPGIDWLLQILNDIRVGSWETLGKPEQGSPAVVKTDEQLRSAAALQLAGMWQSILLHALECKQPWE